MTASLLGTRPFPCGYNGYRLFSPAVLGIATNPYSFAGVTALPSVSSERITTGQCPGWERGALGAGTYQHSSGLGPRRINCHEIGGKAVGQLPAWTTIVGDHLMDVQLAVTRLAERDGVIDEHERAVIEKIAEAQGYVEGVHDEIAIVAALITRGRIPEYRKDRVIELYGSDEPEAA